MRIPQNSINYRPVMKRERTLIICEKFSFKNAQVALTSYWLIVARCLCEPSTLSNLNAVRWSEVSNKQSSSEN